MKIDPEARRRLESTCRFGMFVHCRSVDGRDRCIADPLPCLPRRFGCGWL